MTDTTEVARVPRPRPRVEGDREAEILDATIEVVAELGYDRLTMDAVAAAARASKATLYRRWSTKADLVVDAVSRAKGFPIPPDVDTGSLRGDLIALSCTDGGFPEAVPMPVLAGLLSALHRDEELQKAFHNRFLAPRIAAVNSIYARAVRRGEIAADVDIELLSRTLPSVIVYHAFILGIPPDDELVIRVIDNLLLPAARGSRSA